jgi:hypothetical protein
MLAGCPSQNAFCVRSAARVPSAERKGIFPDFDAGLKGLLHPVASATPIRTGGRHSAEAAAVQDLQPRAAVPHELWNPPPALV